MIPKRASTSSVRSSSGPNGLPFGFVIVDRDMTYVGSHVTLNLGYTGGGGGGGTGGVGGVGGVGGGGEQSGTLHQDPARPSPVFAAGHSIKLHAGVAALSARALPNWSGPHVPLPQHVCQFGCSASASRTEEPSAVTYLQSKADGGIAVQGGMAQGGGGM